MHPDIKNKIFIPKMFFIVYNLILKKLPILYKMIDDVVEWQLDHMADMELEDFYRYHMNKHYEDKRNAIEFNDAWMNYKEITGG